MDESRTSDSSGEMGKAMGAEQERGPSGSVVKGSSARIENRQCRSL